MKVVCINNKIGNSKNFKLNVVYESIDYTFDEKVKLRLPDDYIVFKWDDNIDIWCESKCFITLDEWREKRLNKLKI
jgi:hypothetical protein